MVLGLLAHGPRHGHQIRRDAEQTNVGNWGGVSVGALYRELREMEGEGLVEPLRTEQVGRRPARTVYQISDEGRRELRILRERAIRELHFGPDAFGVALLFGRTWDRTELIGLLRARRQALANALEGVKAECTHLEARGAIGPIDVSLFRRRAMQLEAELRWHDEFEPVLPSLPEPSSQARSEIGEAVHTPESPSPRASPKRASRKPAADRANSGSPPRGRRNPKKS